MMFLRITTLWVLFFIAISCVASDYGEIGPNGFEVVYRGASKSKNLGSLRIWGAGYYDTSKIEPENLFSMDTDTTGLLAGVELKRKGGSIFGLYYHYASEETKWELPSSIPFDIDVDGDAKHHLFGLTFHKSLPICHFLFNVNGGTDQYGLRINGPLNSFEFRPKGYQANFYPEFGFDLPLGKMIGIKPYTALHYHYLHLDEFARAGKEDYHGLNNLLGMRLNLVLGDLLSFQGRASWGHEYLEESPTSVSYFSSIPGQFTPIRCNFRGDTARDWAWFGLGAKLGYGGLRLFADYDLTLNARQTSHTVSCCLCFGW